MDKSSSGEKSNLWGKLFVTMLGSYTRVDRLSTIMQKTDPSHEK